MNMKWTVVALGILLIGCNLYWFNLYFSSELVQKGQTIELHHKLNELERTQEKTVSFLNAISQKIPKNELVMAACDLSGATPEEEGNCVFIGSFILKFDENDKLVLFLYTPPEKQKIRAHTFDCNGNVPGPTQDKKKK